MKFLTLPLLLALVLVARGAPAVQALTPRGNVPEIVASGAIAPLGRMPANSQLRLAISLPLRNEGELTNLLRQLYDRSSPNYHHYLSPQTFAERFGPSQIDYDAVKAFARTHGLAIASEHPNRLILNVTGAVSNLEQALHVKMNVYQHPAEKRTFHAPDAEPTLAVTVPGLRISGLNDYALPKPCLVKSPRNARAINPTDGSGTNGTLYGGAFRAAYAPDTTLQGAGQSVGLLEFDGYAAADINRFLTQNAYPLPGVPLTNVLVDNFDGGQNGGESEVCLDIEMAISMAPGLASILVYEAGPSGSFPDILNRMATDNLASQLSCSWYQGGGPADPACEGIFLEMAAQGQAFLAASGDDDADTGLISFPEDSPHITVVGGTSLYPNQQGGYGSETVWNWNNGHGSSGGISTQYPIPGWQAGLNLTAAQGSATMRNMPDVALTADNIAVWVDGGIGVYGGTSCAAPLWAGFIALVNEQAAQSGQPPVGFLNPALYAIAAGGGGNALHDIVNGDNTSTTSPTLFYAVPGYDLCTGLGTPNGAALINALALPDALGVSPPFVTASGEIGGPFTPTNWVVTLTNSGTSNLNWSVTGAPAWLTVSATNGTLPANGSTYFILALNGAGALPFGIYNAQLLFSNANAFGAQSLAVHLTLRQSLVQNGGFETGDFTGWTLVGDTIIANSVYNSAENDSFGSVVHSGVYGALLGESGFLATLSQTLPTAPNQMYWLSFWLDNYTSAPGQQFEANWNGTNLVNLASPPSFGWTNYQFIVTASGSSSALQFAARNDSAYFGLDDVILLPVPALEFNRVAASGRNLSLGWNSLAGLTYEVQSTTNLAPAAWQNLATVIASTNTAGFTDTNGIGANGQKFYRLALVP